MRNGLAISRQLLKVASQSVGRSLGKAIMGVTSGAGNFGAGLAEGVGASPALGKAIGIGGVGVAGYSGAKKLKRKTDEWRYNHGLY